MHREATSHQREIELLKDTEDNLHITIITITSLQENRTKKCDYLKKEISRQSEEDWSH